jgi:hypothetical protein
VAAVRAEGWAFASGARITIRRLIVRDNAFRGVSFSGGITATMDGVHVLNSPLGVVAGPGLNMTISNSVIAGSNDVGTAGVAVEAQTDASATVGLAIENSVIRSERHWHRGNVGWRRNPCEQTSMERSRRLARCDASGERRT